MPLKRNFLPCRCLRYCLGLKADSFVDNNQSIDSTHVIAQVCMQLYTVQIYMLILYQVERWLRLRRQSCLPSKLQKFQETGWRCLFYLSARFYFSTKKSNLIFSCWWLFYVSALFYGIFCLWEKPWFHSINHCWDGYPYHKVCSEKKSVS